MMSIDKNATKALITFVSSYIDLLEKSLRDVHGNMRETVDGVMRGINDISKKTAEKKKAANEVIVNTYTNPDPEAKESMDSVQDEVNRIMELAAHGGPSEHVSVSAKSLTPAATDAESDRLRRSAGLFSKHMEALETLDDDLSGLLLNMMGALSNDDVISQRLEHVLTALTALRTSLTYILTDFETRCREQEVASFGAHLKAVVFKAYTMEEEKQTYYSVFPGDRPVKKAS